VKDFTYIMVIIAVQRWLGVRANWDWSADPKTSLEKLIAMLLAHSDVSRMKLVAFSTELANQHYASGRRRLAEALGSETMREMSRPLLLAFHHFLAAEGLQKISLMPGITTPACSFAPVVVDGAKACTGSAIIWSMKFFGRGPRERPLGLAVEHGSSLRELQRASRSLSSEIDPSFTKLFAQVLCAQALTYATERSVIKLGLDSLVALRQGLSGGGCDLRSEFEAGWIDAALLDVYLEYHQIGLGIPLAINIAGRLRDRRWFQRHRLIPRVPEKSRLQL
jgi:hypothetical protein